MTNKLDCAAASNYVAVVARITLGFAICISSIACSRKPVAPPVKVINEDNTFDIYWPPRDLTRPRSEKSPPLLNGELLITKHADETPNSFQLQVTLRRPDGEADRTRWNQTLAFPEYDWMSRVRVWDDDQRWLWPNLPFLLRAHGEERVERYGGVDPGKHVDNDFAALLIRPLGHDAVAPMLSAEWLSDEAMNQDKYSVVHVAASDTFTVLLPPPKNDLQSGKIGVWLIYADFLGARPPRSWPREGEYDGGILAYLTVTWKVDSAGDTTFDAQHLIPPTATGFDWAAWSTGTAAVEKNLQMAIPN